VGGAYGPNGREQERICVIGRKPEGKRLLGRPRCMWLDNMDILRCDGVLGTGLVSLRIRTSGELL
jgi:hypothetical protein